MALSARTTAVVMISAAVLVNVAFTGLGMVFDYPDVLKHPAGEVLASFRASQGSVSAWFLLLALGASSAAPNASRRNQAETTPWDARKAARTSAGGFLRTSG